MKKLHYWIAGLLALLTCAATDRASAIASAELYQTQAYRYGRFEARLRFAPGDGVVSSFFLWKEGSELPGTYWNELDFEKLGDDCHLQTNALYGRPLVDTGEVMAVEGDLCEDYHTYTIEWTPESIVWLVDGTELRREEGDVAAAFAENALDGMQIHFNVWPGDATFGGNFDPSTVPVHQYLSWVRYASYADGEFSDEWQVDFDAATLPSGWQKGTWASPKNNSTHAAANVTLHDGIAVLSLTDDDEKGFSGKAPADPEQDEDGSDTDGSDGSTKRSSSDGCSTSSAAPATAGRGSLGLALALAALGYIRRLTRRTR